MIRASTPDATPAAQTRRKAGLIGMTIAGFGSAVEIFREANRLRMEAMERYPFVDS
jgi:hypothetical protein